MNIQTWVQQLTSAETKRAMPVLSFPSIHLMGITVRELIDSSERQAEGMKAIADRVPSAASVSMMDLSVEAEAFGAKVAFSDHEVPTVSDILVNDAEQARELAVPAVGAGRTGRYIEAIASAKKKITDRPVFAGVIGPFSLTGRLMGVTETMINCYDNPEMVEVVLEKATAFLIEYISAYKKVGADGVVMAEPLTGMLSPSMAETFSEPFVRRVIEAVQDETFGVIYHNCGSNTVCMLDSIARVGACAYHFGNAVDMKEVLSGMPKDTLVMGNLDPVGQLKEGMPETVREETLALMRSCCPEYPGFVVSTGCDVPPTVPWENIDAFFAAVQEYYQS